MNRIAVRKVVTAEGREMEEAPEKMPKSPWYSELVGSLKELLLECTAQRTDAIVLRDLRFAF